MSTTEDHNGESTVYELGYLILPSIPEDSISGVVNSIKEIVSKNGGKEFDSEDPINRDLAYAMSKTVGASKYVVNDAYMGWIKFDAEPAQVLVIKSEVEKMNEILRVLLIKTPRETTFTFAQAEAAKEKALEPAPEAPAEEVEAVVE